MQFDGERVLPERVQSIGFDASGMRRSELISQDSSDLDRQLAKVKRPARVYTQRFSCLIRQIDDIVQA